MLQFYPYFISKRMTLSVVSAIITLSLSELWKLSEGGDFNAIHFC